MNVDPTKKEWCWRAIKKKSRIIEKKTRIRLRGLKTQISYEVGRGRKGKCKEICYELV